MRILQPSERIAEVLFGLIMVLTITGSLSVAESGRENVRLMLIGALGCNFAWGIIDAVLYLLSCMAERSGGLRTLNAVRAAEPAKAHKLIAQALPPIVASVLQPAELESLRLRLKDLPPPPAKASLSRTDWLGGIGVFLWVFVTTFPVVIPFLVVQDALTALRISNAVAVVMLFLTGYAYGKCTGRHPWLMGGGMLLLGCVLVVMTMALGG